ncbi:MAG: ABC transporter substrate-binding protein [Candidatus Binatia bacterium]
MGAIVETVTGGSRLDVVYGKLEGTDQQFNRDPTGYLALSVGIFLKKGLNVSYRYVQGIERRLHELERGTANISLLVGRAALKHFLDKGKTRLLGCSMNTCPYRLVVQTEIQAIGDLHGKSLACRESTADLSRLAEVLQQTAKLQLSVDVRLKQTPTDREAMELLSRREVQAALLPRPYAIFAREKGLKAIEDWPEVIDDPMPSVLETTEAQYRGRQKDFNAFMEAYCEGIVYLKNNRDETIRMLGVTFGQSPAVAGKAYDEYLIYLNDPLTVDMRQLERLLAKVAPENRNGSSEVASRWFLAGVRRS